MRTILRGSLAALCLVTALASATAAGSLPTRYWADCPGLGFSIDYQLDFESFLLVKDDKLLLKSVTRTVYTRSSDDEPLGVADAHYHGSYPLDEDGSFGTYSLAGASNLVLADGHVLRDRGIRWFVVTDAHPEGIVDWQAGQHPDFKAALCDVGAALP